MKLSSSSYNTPFNLLKSINCVRFKRMSPVCGRFAPPRFVIAYFKGFADVLSNLFYSIFTSLKSFLQSHQIFLRLLKSFLQLQDSNDAFPNRGMGRLNSNDVFLNRGMVSLNSNDVFPNRRMGRLNSNDAFPNTGMGRFN